MKSWYLIDDCTSKKSRADEERLNAATQEEAVALARAEWNALTNHDKKLRDAFYIGYAELDEEGCVDLDTMTDIVDIIADCKED